MTGRRQAATTRARDRATYPRCASGSVVPCSSNEGEEGITVPRSLSARQRRQGR